MKRNTLATIERRAATLDYFVGETEEWETVTRAWIDWWPDTGTEQFENGQVKARVSGTAKTLWASDLATVDSACRLRFTGTDGIERTVQIERVLNWHNQNKELHFLCVEAV